VFLLFFLLFLLFLVILGKCWAAGEAPFG